MNKIIEVKNFQQLDNLTKKIFNLIDLSNLKKNKQYFILLNGPLGAGKTTFTKSLLKQFKYEGNVSSPTFNIHHEYKTNDFIINHFDFYRFQGKSININEIESFCELWYNSLNIIEWPGIILDFLDQDQNNIIIQLDFSVKDETTRIINIESF